MGKLLFIDSDDINGLSMALQEALEKRGVRFTRSMDDDYYDEEPDIDPYLGVMPRHSSYGHCGSGGCGSSIGVGGCGSSIGVGGCGSSIGVGGCGYSRC